MSDPLVIKNAVPRNQKKTRSVPEWCYSLVILAFCLLCWEVFVRLTDVNPMLLPAPSGVASTFGAMVADGSLLRASWNTFLVLTEGVIIGLILATILASLAIFTVLGARVLRTIASVLTPLPGVAILPLCIIWFGFGNTTVIIVLLNTIVWVLALNLLIGFQSMSITLRRVGESLELSKLRMLADIYLPAAIPTALTGFRLAWAYGWRTIIAVELVIGGGSGNPGLGSLIDRARYNYETDRLFSSLVAIVIIGFAIEQFVRFIEQRTAVRWGLIV